MITQTRLVQSRPRQNPDPAPLTNKWCVLNLAAETDNWLGIIEASDVKTAFENAHAAWESHADRIGIFNAQAFENELASFEQRFEKDAPATAWREAAYAVTIHHFGYFPEFLSVLPTLGVLTTPRDVACHSSGTTLVPNFPDETDLARPEKSLCRGTIYDRDLSR